MTQDQPTSMHVNANQWHLFELYCKDFWVASEYAAERGWWLHCWDWKTDENAPEEVQVIVLRNPDG